MGRLVRLLFGEPSTGFVRPIYTPEPPIRRMDCCPYCRAKLQSSKIIGVSRRGHVHADKREWTCGTMIRRDFFREVEVKIGSDCEPNVQGMATSPAPQMPDFASKLDRG